MYSHNHVPFLHMLAAIGDDQDDQQQAGGAGLQQQRPGKVQLGEFWPQAPNTWVTAAKLKFAVANITGERKCFPHAVSAMCFNVLHAVMDLVENPPVVNPNTKLKGCSRAAD